MLAGLPCCVQEKRSTELAEQQEQQRLDLMMEIERLKALEAYQVRGRVTLLSGRQPCNEWAWYQVHRCTGAPVLARLVRHQQDAGGTIIMHGAGRLCGPCIMWKQLSP